jgi:hypothetical protein
MSETRNIHQRIAAAMQKVTYIQKEKKAGMRYSIVSHDAVTAKVRPVLLAEGVIYYPVNLTNGQTGNRTDCTVVVRFANIDNPADCIDVPSFGYGIDDQDKGPGKAMSYAVKYALLKALGLESGDDPDEDQNVVFNNPVVVALETAIGLAEDAAGMDHVGEEIKKQSASLSNVELAKLRQMFTARRKQITSKE